MLTNLDFTSYLSYTPPGYLYGNPRGRSELSRKSQTVCYNIKRPDIHQIEHAISHMVDNEDYDPENFFGDDVLLIPIPRSAPLVKGAAAWPPLLIAQTLLSKNLGGRYYSLSQKGICR